MTTAKKLKAKNTERKTACREMDGAERAAIAKAYLDPAVTTFEQFCAVLRKELPGWGLRSAQAYISWISRWDETKNLRREDLDADLTRVGLEQRAAAMREKLEGKKAAQALSEAAHAVQQPLALTTAPTPTAPVPAKGPVANPPDSSTVAVIAGDVVPRKLRRTDFKMPSPGRFPMVHKDLSDWFKVSMTYPDMNELTFSVKIRNSAGNIEDRHAMLRPVFEKFLTHINNRHTLRDAADLTRSWLKRLPPGQLQTWTEESNLSVESPKTIQWGPDEDVDAMVSPAPPSKEILPAEVPPLTEATPAEDPPSTTGVPLLTADLLYVTDSAEVPPTPAVPGEASTPPNGAASVVEVPDPLTVLMNKIIKVFADDRSYAKTELEVRLSPTDTGWEAYIARKGSSVKGSDQDTSAPTSMGALEALFRVTRASALASAEAAVERLRDLSPQDQN